MAHIKFKETKINAWHPASTTPPQIEQSDRKLLLIAVGGADQKITEGFYEQSSGKYFTHVREYDGSLGELPPTPENIQKINGHLHWVIKEANDAARWMIIEN
jgi:hypothetical protein